MVIGYLDIFCKVSAQVFTIYFYCVCVLLNCMQWYPFFFTIKVMLFNLEKEKQRRKDHNTWYQIVLQGHCSQNKYWHKNRYIDQWNRIDSPEINPCLFGQLIFDKGGRSIKWSKNSLFDKWYWKIWKGTWQKMKLNHQLTPYTRINSKWIKHLNISHNTIKVLKENIGSKISVIPHSNIFTNTNLRAMEIKKKKINKWHLSN